MPLPTRPFRARPRVTARSLAGALALSSTLVLGACDPGALPPTAPTAAPTTLAPTAAPAGLNAPEILQLARPSLVLLSVTFPNAAGSGTGFVVAVEGETAVIVTNAHVVAGSTSHVDSQSKYFAVIT
jgi:S1-C subfamily serine protease